MALKIPTVTINGHRYVTDYAWDIVKQRYFVTVCDYERMIVSTHVLREQFLEGDGFDIVGAEVMRVRNKAIKKLEKKRCEP